MLNKIKTCKHQFESFFFSAKLGLYTLSAMTGKKSIYKISEHFCKRKFPSLIWVFPPGSQEEKKKGWWVINIAKVSREFLQST